MTSSRRNYRALSWASLFLKALGGVTLIADSSVLGRRRSIPNALALPPYLRGMYCFTHRYPVTQGGLKWARNVFAFVLFGLISVTSCGSVDSDPEDAVRVLFVGNSLTYANNLPAIVQALARASGGRPFEYRMVAFPNYSLEDHWREGTAKEALSGEQWDFVVLQQGPSSLPENQQLLKDWTGTFAAEARRHGVEPALFTVWPSADRSFAFPDVIDAYASAAESVDGLLLPAGAAWLAAWDRDASLPLYGPDDFHPSEMGSYLAALVIYGGLYDSTPEGLPSSIELADGTLIRIASSAASKLRAAAKEALDDRDKE